MMTGNMASPAHTQNYQSGSTGSAIYSQHVPLNTISLFQESKELSVTVSGRNGIAGTPASPPSAPSVTQQQEDIKRDKLYRRLVALSELPEGWNGEGFAKPMLDAITRAIRWEMKLFKTATNAGVSLPAPHVSASAQGEVVLEWWREERKITIYIAPDGDVEYIRSWGVDIENDMADGTANTGAEGLQQMRWLQGI